MKYLLHKESLFSSLLVDVFKVYMDGKPSRLPEPAYAVDYVIRMCQQELAARANQEKNGGAFVPGPLTLCLTNNIVATTAIDMVLPNKIPAQMMAPLSSSGIAPTVLFSAQTTVSKTIASTSSVIAVVTTMLDTSSTTSTVNTTALTVGSSTTVPSTSAYISGASRPRGRPPGSKNSNMSSTISSGYSSSSTNPFLPPRLDPNLMAAAIMGMYSNQNLMQGMPTGFSDPATVNSLLNEYNKLSNLTGMSSYLGNMQPAAAFNPSSTVSSALAKSTSGDTSISAIAMAANKSAAASTVISLGSGQLTITPTLSSTAPTAKQAKDLALNPVNSAYVSLLKAEAELRLKSQSKSSTKFDKQAANYNKPAVSVTKVPQQKASTSTTSQSSNINLPKSLPKSLTITPTSAGYSGKPQPLSNQAPQITLQPEKQTTIPSKSAGTTDKSKKKSQSAQRSLSSSSMMNPFSAFSLQDYTQQMAILNQYTEMMKGVPTSGGRLLADLAKPAVTKGPSSSSSRGTGQPSGKSKPSKPSCSATLPKDSSVVKQMQQLLGAQHAASRTAPAAHQQQKLKSSASAFGTIAQPKAHQSSASPKMTSYSPLPPFAMPSSTSPIILSPSPNRSPNLHSTAVPPALTPPGHQISPTKTLQQKLAERQRALADASKAESSRAACMCKSIL